MRAMILAAGLGTRLRPLTDDRPKALVELEGRTLLQITLARLRSFGIHEIIVNVHHFADMVVEYLKANDNFGMHIEVSREECLLDTGGGLKKAAHFFLQGNDPDEPFVVHNVDVISTFDLRQMLQFHQTHGALATLAVQERRTSRYLLFNQHSELCGRRSENDSQAEMVRPSAEPKELAFCGVHIISVRLFSALTEEGVFAIVPAYLRLAALGEKILGFRADEYYWRDLGTLQSLDQATKDPGARTLLL